MDRGVIPGASKEFDKFISDNTETDSPDVYLGLLQSSFIVGLLVGSLTFGHMIHYYGRFFLVGIGLSVWISAVIMSGLSYYTSSYTFLIFARMLSGFGEASLQCSAPPWIQQTALPSQRGTWLSIYYTAISVGTALGYAYSSFIAESIGWQWSFFIEAAVMAPFVIFFFVISPYYPCVVSHEGSGALSESLYAKPKPTLVEEFKIVMSSPIFLCLTAVYASQTFTLQGMSTFGSAFLIGLGFFDKESQASTVFGVLISISGLIATPLGGMILDSLIKKKKSVEESSTNLVSSADADGDGYGNVLGEEDEKNEYNTIALLESSSSVLGKQRRHEISSLTKLIVSSSIMGLLFLSLTYTVYNIVLYLFMVCIGCASLFLTFSAINMGFMLSVPAENRSFAIAIMNVLIHMFGDVPSPIIAGLIKDMLAPDCVSSSDSNDDGASSSAACRSQGGGLRLTLLLLTLWLIWGVFFTLLAMWLNWKDCRTFSDVSKTLCPSKNKNSQSRVFDVDYNTLGKMDWQYSRGAGDGDGKALPSPTKSKANKFDI
eukprot:gene24156-32573_t